MQWILTQRDYENFPTAIDTALVNSETKRSKVIIAFVDFGDECSALDAAEKNGNAVRDTCWHTFSSDHVPVYHNLGVPCKCTLGGGTLGQIVLIYKCGRSS